MRIIIKAFWFVYLVIFGLGGIASLFSLEDVNTWLRVILFLVFLAAFTALHGYIYKIRYFKRVYWKVFSVGLFIAFLSITFYFIHHTIMVSGFIADYLVNIYGENTLYFLIPLSMINYGAALPFWYALYRYAIRKKEPIWSHD